MSRSIWKPNYIHSQVRIGKISPINEIFVQNRSTIIISSIVGKLFQVYNGIRWFAITIEAERVGQLLGEFAPTRKRPTLKKKKIKKIKVTKK